MFFFSLLSFCIVLPFIEHKRKGKMKMVKIDITSPISRVCQRPGREHGTVVGAANRAVQVPMEFPVTFP